MTAALALAVLARQAASAPSLPPGTSMEFAKNVLTVESRLVEGDVAGARAAVQALPVRQPRLAWANDAALPAALKAKRAEGLAMVLERWNASAKNFAPQVVGSGPADLTIEFGSGLPDGADGLPLPTRIDSIAPFHATISLLRGKPGVPLRPEEMYMEVAYAIGRYLGVPDAPLPGSSMYRDGRPNLLTFMPRADDWVLAARNLDLADRMRAAVEAGKPLGLVPPVVHLAKERLDLGSVEQGKPLRGEIDVENLGTGSLDYRVVRDCECFYPIQPGHVAAQGRKTIPFTINTSQYAGRIDKLLLFESNDPDHPTIELPITFVARPAYRLLRPGGDRVVSSTSGGTYDYFFFTPPGSPIHVVTARWEGMGAKVTFEPWSGVLADPDLGEGPLPRTGWRFHVHVPANLPAGRPNGTLTVVTDSRLYPTVPVTLYIQKGIVADDTALGTIAAGDKSSFLVDRPNAPFKILKVDAGPFFKTNVSDRRSGWEYRVELEYRGGAPQGDFVGRIRIFTNDPKQPVIETLARGIVK